MIITTTADPSRSMAERARTVSRRCGVPFVENTVLLPQLLREHRAGLAYIVERTREVLRSEATSLFVHAGMFKLKRDLGTEHPLIRAVLHRGDCSSILDATLGLAGDALHVAAVLGVPVRGIEGSPVMFSLLEEGLPRLAASSDPAASAAGLVTAKLGDAFEQLASMPAASVDVVMLDPMFEVLRPAGPGFSLLRDVAHPCDDPMRMVALARRVARSHVVFKYPKRPVFPPCDACIDGKALRYLIFDAEPA